MLKYPKANPTPYKLLFGGLSRFKSLILRKIMELKLNNLCYYNPWLTCGVHSLKLSYTLENMKCDSRASFLARTFASPCLGHKPKVRVAKVTTNKKVKKKFVRVHH
jgi:hypothetical protein